MRNIMNNNKNQNLIKQKKIFILKLKKKLHNFKKKLKSMQIKLKSMVKQQWDLQKLQNQLLGKFKYQKKMLNKSRKWLKGLLRIS